MEQARVRNRSGNLYFERSSQRRKGDEDVIEIQGTSKRRTPSNFCPQGEAVNISAADSPRLEAIRIRAYEIYIERGGQPGHDLDDWFQAKRELEPKVGAANEVQ